MRVYHSKEGPPFIADNGLLYLLRQEKLVEEPRVSSAEKHIRRYHGVNLSGKSLLIYRAGGHGDLAMLAPIIDEIKRRWPTSRIVLAVARMCNVTADRIEGLDEKIHYPVLVERHETYDYHLILESVFHRPIGLGKHGTDAFAAVANITVPDDNKRPKLASCSPRERAIARQLVEHLPRPLVSISVAASTKLRTWPLENMMGLVSGLARLNCGIVFLGDDSSRRLLKRDLPRGQENLAGIIGMGVACSIVQISDLFIGPDSGLLHMAGSFKKEVPSIGLFGPIDPALRTLYYEECTPMVAHGSCDLLPCNPMVFAKNCPRGEPPPKCLKALTPTAVFLECAKTLERTVGIWPGLVELRKELL